MHIARPSGFYGNICNLNLKRSFFGLIWVSIVYHCYASSDLVNWNLFVSQQKIEWKIKMEVYEDLWLIQNCQWLQFVIVLINLINFMNHYLVLSKLISADSQFSIFDSLSTIYSIDTRSDVPARLMSGWLDLILRGNPI